MESEYLGYYSCRMPWDNDWRPHASSLERSDPDLWGMCYPRSYVQADRWASPKCLATDMSWTVKRCYLPPAAIDALPDGLARSQMVAMFSEIVRLRVPLYFVTAELANAVLATRPPQTINLSTVHLPMESAVFMLPEDLIRTEEGHVVPWIAYSRIQKGQSVGDEEFGRDAIRVTEGPGAVFTAASIRNSPLHPYKQSRIVMYPFTMGKFTGDLDLSCHLTALENSSGEWEKHSPAYQMSMAHVAEASAQLIIGLLLLMTSRPDLVETGHATGTKFKRGTELWTPNIIGRDYRIKRSPSDPESGSGIAKRAHWRRGHWRDQAYGPAFSLRKHIWLEPTWVAGVE